ncbi:MAG: DUF2156 domain-containing protein [Fusobacteriaceae bacterium]
MWQEIDIRFKEVLEKYSKIELEMCDYSFVNLYLWSFGDKIKYCEREDILYIKGNYLFQDEYFMPIPLSGDIKDIKRGIDFLLEKGRDINFVSEDFYLNYKDEYEFEEMLDNYDYIYSVQDLIELKGRKYSKKKNKKSQFTKLYNYRYEKLVADNLKEVIKFQESWCIKKDCINSENLKSESLGLENIFENIEETDIVGGVLYVDKDVVAYTLGEKLSHDTVVIHVEKADELYNGSYQAINSIFLEKEWAHMTYVNREDDSGIEGIRKAKESYYPIKKVKKYRIKG